VFLFINIYTWPALTSTSVLASLNITGSMSVSVFTRFYNIAISNVYLTIIYVHKDIFILYF